MNGILSFVSVPRHLIDETTLAKIPGWSDVFIPPTQFYIPTDCTENHFFYEKE
jgi:hypothetical protein